MTSQTDADKIREAQRVVKHISKSTTPAKKGKRDVKRLAAEAAGHADPVKVDDPIDVDEPVDEPVEGGENDVPLQVLERFEATGSLEESGRVGDGPDGATPPPRSRAKVAHTEPAVERTDATKSGEVEKRAVQTERVDPREKTASRETFLDVLSRVDRTCS